MDLELLSSHLSIILLETALPCYVAIGLPPMDVTFLFES